MTSSEKRIDTTIRPGGRITAKGMVVESGASSSLWSASPEKQFLKGKFILIAQKEGRRG